MLVREIIVEFDNNSNAAIVKSLVDPVVRQRFAKLRADRYAKLTDPNYDHNPDALNQHNAYPKKQHAEYVGHMKNIEMFDKPHRMIAFALNAAGLTPEEVLQNLPKGYQIPQQKPVNELENMPVAQKIEPIKMSNPPKAPDSTIPRTRDGYTTKDGTTYKQDKYDENIMHVSNGGGTYTFDGSRLIRWKTPKIKGYSQIHDFIKSTITVDANTSVTTKNPDFGQKPADAEILKKNGIDLSTSTSVIDTNAVYDLKGNLIDKGEMGIRSGGASTGISDKEIKLNFVISNNLSIHARAPRNTNIDPKTKQQLAQLVAKTQSGDMSQGNLLATANAFRKAGASITFKSPANGTAIPFNQGVEMLRQAGE